jgi:sulfite exporter TauE/SafE
MHAMVLSQVRRMRLVRGVGGLVVALGLATLLVTLLDQVAGVPNASSGYLSR